MGGTHAYVVSLAGAKKLLELLPKARYHVDLAAWSLKQLNLFACKEFLATQSFDESDTNMTWAWKTAVFALPVLGGRLIVEMGPSSSLFIVFVLLAACMRSFRILGFAILYCWSICMMIRW